MTTIDDNTLMRVVALTAAPAFVDIYGSITGTIGNTYNPTFIGERGFMLHADAAPLDIGVELTGDQLAICWNWTPYEIDEASRVATPIAAPTAVVQERKKRIAKGPKVTGDTVAKPPSAASLPPSAAALFED